MSLTRLVPMIVVAVLVAAGSAQAAPVLVAPPSVGGEPFVGARLTAVDTQVDDAAPEDVTLTWERSGEHGFEAIPEAHDAAYAPTIVDVGHRLRVHVMVETPTGVDEGWSEPTAAIGYRAGDVAERPRIGPAAGAPARLSRWIVVAGDSVRLTGQVAAGLAAGEARLVLQPTVPAYDAVEAPVTVSATGAVAAVVEPTVNASVWLELTPVGEATQRIRLGLVGVRPRIVVRLGARADGRDGAGRALIRDLRILDGSVIAPGVSGLQLSWEGRLPGERSGTAVCRSSERVASGARGRLRGGCRTRGSWSTVRWRLVLDPGTSDPAAAPFLPAASAWTAPILGRGPSDVATLPTAGARRLG